MNQNGKGSRPRPLSVSNEEYSKRWDAIFARDNPEDELDFLQEIEHNKKTGVLTETTIEKKDE
jgi:hypothetical protein